MPTASSDRRGNLSFQKATYPARAIWMMRISTSCATAPPPQLADSRTVRERVDSATGPTEYNGVLQCRSRQFSSMRKSAAKSRPSPASDSRQRTACGSEGHLPFLGTPQYRETAHSPEADVFYFNRKRNSAANLGREVTHWRLRSTSMRFRNPNAEAFLELENFRAIFG